MSRPFDARLDLGLPILAEHRLDFASQLQGVGHATQLVFELEL